MEKKLSVQYHKLLLGVPTLPSSLFLPHNPIIISLFFLYFIGNLYLNTYLKDKKQN